MPAPLIQIKEVTRRFGNATALHSISLDIHSGEFFTLLGPSGCGKTTLLRMIAGFDAPDEGDILLDGKSIVDLPPEQRPIHTVFQNYALFPHLTVAENIAFPLKMAKKEHAFIQKRIKESLELIHLEDKGEHYPHQLSGGQCQRVALARSLVNQPQVLLLDEPTAALDAKLRENLLIELIRLQRDTGITFIFVTHAQNEALALSHRIAVMSKGHIEQLDEPSAIYNFPANRFVADFIGQCNLIDCDVADISHEHQTLVLNTASLGNLHAPGRPHLNKGEGCLALRPEHVLIASPDTILPCDNQFEGIVSDFLYIGDVTTYRVTLPSGHLIEALLPNTGWGKTRFFEVGDTVKIGWHAQSGYYLPNTSASTI